ncbi:MAG: FCD domain-containing protein [Anaerolineales bacterium]|jgi:DNA-binding FadR family transcriptional regulator
MAIELDSEFMTYLTEHARTPGVQLPPMSELARELGISISKLREQLEVARALGFVDVRPRLGIHTLDYSIAPGLRASLQYALAVDPDAFNLIEDLREHIESCYWHNAVRRLNAGDIQHLRDLIERAWRKLRGNPIQIPHSEHRDLHLTIFSRLENPFVLGVLEAYWDAYERIGLALYADYQYLEQVWLAHEAMVEAIAASDETGSYQALVDHFDILQTRPQAAGAGEGSKSHPVGMQHQETIGSRNA